MGLIVMSAKELSKKLKATVQKTGRLGFAQTTADELKLNESCSIKFYFDDERKDSPVLQLLNCKDGDAFSVLKSGDYYYLSTAALFDKHRFEFVDRRDDLFLNSLHVVPPVFSQPRIFNYRSFECLY